MHIRQEAKKWLWLSGGKKNPSGRFIYFRKTRRSAVTFRKKPNALLIGNFSGETALSLNYLESYSRQKSQWQNGLH